MAGFFSPETLEQIRAASDIVDIIGSYIPLKRAGINFVALCPFHKEKTPSFNVTPSKQIFYCFGCHKGGNVFTFVKEYENIEFPDAVRRLAERARIPLEETGAPNPETRHLKDNLLQIHEQITQRWQTALESDPTAQIARDYLAKRGVSKEAVQLFRLGYALDVWDDTVNWAKSKNWEPPLMEQAGLIIKKEGAEHFYDRFRGRLIFPICDEQGRVVGFSGRVLSGDEKTAKYVNSPESAIFTKGKVMFGLDKSKRAVLDKQSAVICEGQLDLIACFMAGITNVVAPQGTALTADHARILKRYAEEVILCFDSDNAGQKAAVRSLDTLLTAGFSIRVATVPAPHDPDSFIKELGAPAFAELINKARGFFDYYLARLCATNDVTTDSGMKAVVRAMAEAVHKTGNAVVLDIWAQKTALKLGVTIEAMRKEFSQSSKGGSMVPEEPDAPEAEPISKPPLRECWLLRCLLESDDHVSWLRAHLEIEWLTDLTAREIFTQRFAAESEQSWPGLHAWLAADHRQQWQSLVSELLTENEGSVDVEMGLKGSSLREGAIKILRDKHLEKEIASWNQKLAAPDLSEEQQAEILARVQNLRQIRKQPLAPKFEEGEA